jgi:hypothetical protein
MHLKNRETDQIKKQDLHKALIDIKEKINSISKEKYDEKTKEMCNIENLDTSYEYILILEDLTDDNNNY